MRVPIIVLTCLLFISGVFGQTPGNTRGRTMNDIRQDNLENRMNTMRGNDRPMRDRSESRLDAANRLGNFRPLMTAEFEEETSVDSKVLAAYHEIIASSQSGIFKLLIPGDCQKKKSTVSMISRCYQRNVNIAAFSNAFSFRENKKAVFARSDIALSGEHIVGGRHSVQTIIVALGDVAFVGVDLDTAGVSYLAKYNPSTQSNLIDEEYDMFRNGLTVTGFANQGSPIRHSYGKIAKLSSGTTYAVRSIAYRPVGAEQLAKDQDVIVVFRVVDYDKESATIIWKELRRGDGLEMIEGEIPPVVEEPKPETDPNTIKVN